MENEFFDKVGKGIMEEVNRAMNSLDDTNFEIKQRDRRDLAVAIAGYVIKKLSKDVNEGLWIYDASRQVYSDEVISEN